LKLTPSGNFSWARPMYAAAGSWLYPRGGVAVAGSKVVVAGEIYGGPNLFGPTYSSGYLGLSTSGVGDYDGFVASFDPAGNLYNAVTLGNSSTDDKVARLVANATGDVFLTGYGYCNGGLAFGTNVVAAAASPSGWVGYVAKLGTKLNLEWIVGATPATDSDCYPASIAIDSSGCNLYVTGEILGTVDFDPSSSTDLESASATPRSDGSIHAYDAYHPFIWSLDKNGVHSWVEQPAFGPEPGSGGRGNDIAVSSLGRLSVVGGFFDSSIPGSGAFIYRK